MQVMRWIVLVGALATTGCVGYELRSEGRSLIAAGAGDQMVVRTGEAFAPEVFVYRQAAAREGLCVITGVHSYRDLRPVRQSFEAFALPSETGACPTDAMAYATLGTGVDVKLLRALLARIHACLQAPDADCGDLRRPAANSMAATVIANLDKGMPTAERYGKTLDLQYWFDLPTCEIGDVEFSAAGPPWRVKYVGCAVGW